MQQIQLATTDKVQYVQHAPSIIDQLKAGDLPLIQELLDFAEQNLKSTSESAVRKFLVIRLIKDGIVLKSGKLINAIANHKTFLPQIEEVCSYEPGNVDDSRGKNMFKNQDPQISAQFLRLCLELVSHLASAYPSDAKKNPTKFCLVYDRLKQKNVHFPEQSDLMQPLKKPTTMSKSNFDNDSPRNIQNEKKVAVSQVQFQQSNEDQANKNNVMLELNKLKKNLTDDMDMIKDALSEQEGEKDYLMDVLETYAQQFSLTSSTFKKQISKAQQYEDALSDQELKQLLDMQEFTQKYPKIHQQFIAQGSTNSAYLILKQTVLSMINKIFGHENNLTGTPGSNIDIQQQKKEAVKQQQQQQQIQQQQQQQKQQQQLQQQQQQENQLKQQQEIEKNIREQKERQNEQNRRDEDERKKRDEQRDQRKREEDHKKQEEAERKRIQFEQSRIQEQQKIEQLQGRNTNEVQNGHNQFASQNNQNSQIDQYHENVQNRSTGTFNQLHQQQPPQSHNLGYQSQQQKIDDQYSKIRQSQISVSPLGFKPNEKQHFEQDFDDISQSSFISNGPRQINRLPLKSHRGRQVQFDDSPFAMLFQYGLGENLMKKWKSCNVRGNGVLLETNEIQVGVTCSLQFNSLSQKNYLKIQIFIGNKLHTQIKQLNVIYEGDNQKLMMWVKPEKIDSILYEGKQAKQELILAFKDSSYVSPTMIIDALVGESQMIHHELFLPATLLRFLDFNDIETGIFRPKWRAKKSQIMKSEMFKINPQIVRSGSYFKRFFPRLCEFMPFQNFVDQKIDYSVEPQNIKYRNYKLGGVFELFESHTEYMMKIIVYPNMMSCIQIIPHQTNSKIAECLLNTIVFIVGQLD